MAKLLVVDRADDSRVPFLRGILTRALQDIGLSFEDAYRIASDVRAELDDASEVTTKQLRKRVEHHLEPLGEAVLQSYATCGAMAPTIHVRSPDGDSTRYSRGRHRLSLEACGLTSDDAAEVSAEMYRLLVVDGVRDITLPDLRHRTYDYLGERLGEAAARRYLVWEEFRHEDRPLIVLIGGTTAVGKSTVATRLAHVLDIVRTQSTDMLREVMRMMVPERLTPVLHSSSFEAWRRLPAAEQEPGGGDGALIRGYLTQAELLSVACEAVMQRAVRERTSLILEGVHMHPALIDRIAKQMDAIVVGVTLAVLKEKDLRRRIRGRGKQVPKRRAARYLKGFHAIWSVQSYLLSEADRVDVPIVSNSDVDATVHVIMRSILDELAKTFKGTPDRVFAQP